MFSIKYKKLRNGAKIILARNKSLQSIVVSASFNVGIKNESNKIYGISHFTEHLICQNKTLNQKLDIFGALVIGSTYKETTNYLLQIPKSNFEDAFDVFINSLLNLNIKDSDVKKEKKIILEEINIYQNDDIAVAEDVLEKLMFPSSYMGRNLFGTVYSVKKLTKKDIEVYHQKYYNPNNLVVCLSGDIDLETENKIIKVVQEWQNKTELLEKFIKNIGTCPDKQKKHLVVKKNKSKQIETVICYKGFDVFNKKKYALMLLSAILCRGYNSRLFKKISEEKGLAYYLNSFCVEYLKGGYLEIRFTAQKDNLREILEIIGNEIKNILVSGINKKELVRAKTIFIHETSLNLEDPVILSEYLAGETCLIGKIPDKKEKLFSNIKKITTKDILETASQVLSKENLYLFIIGDAPTKKGLYLKYLL